jgi:hypothetical protein
MFKWYVSKGLQALWECTDSPNKRYLFIRRDSGEQYSSVTFSNYFCERLMPKLRANGESCNCLLCCHLLNTTGGCTSVVQCVCKVSS